jgi:hypothetical protein
MNRKQFWKVTLSVQKYEGERYEKYVFARNAAEAERRALTMQKAETKTPGLYVISAILEGYVH